MTEYSLITALNLAFIGMSFVVVFLFIFLLATKLMSYVVQKFIIENNITKQDTTIDEKAEFIIKNAIKQHIKNV